MPSAPPDFTVIIPTKDRPAMFRRALLSVMAQTDADFDILVADDGAGAAAADAIGSPHIRAFVTGCVGQVPSRNAAIGKATGRWIAWLDDDDWWDATDHLTALAEALRSGAQLAYGSGRVVREHPDGAAEPPVPFDALYDAAVIRRDNKLLVSSLAYERQLHAAHGYFDESLPYYWDWDWYLRLTDAGIRFAPARSRGACISARLDNVSAQANDAARAVELARLSAKHGLTGVQLKNHERIAREHARQGHGRAAGSADAPSAIERA